MIVTDRKVEIIKSEDPKFFNVYLLVHHADKRYAELNEKYKKVKGAYISKDGYITTSLKVILDNKWEEDLGYIVPNPTEDHLIRKSIKLEAKSIEIDNIVLKGNNLDYVEIIDNFIENDQLVVIDIPSNSVLEDEILKYQDIILPLACSRKTLIISGLEKDIDELLKPYICYERNES